MRTVEHKGFSSRFFFFSLEKKSNINKRTLKVWRGEKRERKHFSNQNNQLFCQLNKLSVMNWFINSIIVVTQIKGREQQQQKISFSFYYRPSKIEIIQKEKKFVSFNELIKSETNFLYFLFSLCLLTLLFIKEVVRVRMNGVFFSLSLHFLGSLTHTNENSNCLLNCEAKTDWRKRISRIVSY